MRSDAPKRPLHHVDLSALRGFLTRHPWAAGLPSAFHHAFHSASMTPERLRPRSSMPNTGVYLIFPRFCHEVSILLQTAYIAYSIAAIAFEKCSPYPAVSLPQHEGHLQGWPLPPPCFMSFMEPPSPNGSRHFRERRPPARGAEIRPASDVEFAGGPGPSWKSWPAWGLQGPSSFMRPLAQA